LSDYPASFECAAPGRYRVDVSVGGEAVGGSPREIEVHDGAWEREARAAYEATGRGGPSSGAGAVWERQRSGATRGSFAIIVRNGEGAAVQGLQGDIRVLLRRTGQLSSSQPWDGFDDSRKAATVASAAGSNDVVECRVSDSGKGGEHPVEFDSKLVGVYRCEATVNGEPVKDSPRTIEVCCLRSRALFVASCVDLHFLAGFACS
jgi:hypothetical protein